MNSHLLGQVAHQHVTDLRQAASHNRRVAALTRPASHRGAIRRRAGWTLVHIGLRLATGSADA